MVTIVEPTPRASIVISTATGEVTHDTGQGFARENEAAENAGLVDAMNNMNDESRYHDSTLRNQYADTEGYAQSQYDSQGYEIPPESYEGYGPDTAREHEEDQSFEANSRKDDPKAKRSKKKKPDLSAARHALKERYEKQLESKEAMHQHILQQKEEEKRFIQKTYELELQKRKVDEEIGKVSDVLFQAKENQDVQTEIDANILLQKLVNRQAYVERDISHVTEEVRAFQDLMQEPEVDPAQAQIEQLAEQELYNYSDRRELQSPHYSEFLERYSICNPYHPDYDRDLNDEIWQLRKKHNRDLKVNGESAFIGSAEYYQEVEDMISSHFGRTQQQSSRRRGRPPTGRQAENGYEDEYFDPQQYQAPNDTYYGDTQMPQITIRPFEEHYDSNYAPNHDPSFRKRTDERDQTGGFVGGGAPNPHYQQPYQQQRPYQQQPYERQEYTPRGGGYDQGYTHPNDYAPVSPVSRDGRRQPSAVRLDPRVETIAIAMKGMVDPRTGRELNQAERIEYYRREFKG